MLDNPGSSKDRIVKAALALNKCVAEFGDDLNACAERFDELNAACYELECWKEDIQFIDDKLHRILEITREYGQPTRGMMIGAEVVVIKSILNRWRETIQ